MKTVLLFAPKKYGYQPVSYFDASEHLRGEIAGGCGPGGFGDLLIPDTLYGLSVMPACSIHDWMYHFGETIEDKKSADRIFLNNMMRIIKIGTRFKLIRGLRYRRAKTYYIFVKEFGGPSFWKNTNDNSELRTMAI